MPRKARRPKKRLDRLTTSQRAYLVDGFTFGSKRPFETEEQARAAWRQHREELLQEHIAKFPCSRPQAWWWFENHKRQELAGPDENSVEVHQAFPNAFLPLDQNTKHLESELQYLVRNNLLTVAEKRILARGNQESGPAEVVRFGAIREDENEDDNEEDERTKQGGWESG
jgi:hypothetical protein